MSDLRESLDSAFAAIDPGQAPVAAAMLAGRKIRNRRWAGMLAGVAAVVAVAVACVPVLVHHRALPSPTPSSIRVTVNPPGPHSPAGTIASGLVGTQPWSVRIEKPGTAGCLFTGTDLPAYPCTAMLPTPTGDPISLDGTGATKSALHTGRMTLFISYGLVQPGVASARVLLADGTVLTLHPVVVGGTRWVAFATPAGVRVERVTAYSRTGEIATATPASYDPDGFPAFVTGFPIFSPWRRPG